MIALAGGGSFSTCVCRRGAAAREFVVTWGHLRWRGWLLPLGSRIWRGLKKSGRHPCGLCGGPHTIEAGEITGNGAADCRVLDVFHLPRGEVEDRMLPNQRGPGFRDGHVFSLAERKKNRTLIESLPSGSGTVTADAEKKQKKTKLAGARCPGTFTRESRAAVPDLAAQVQTQDPGAKKARLADKPRRRRGQGDLGPAGCEFLFE